MSKTDFIVAYLKREIDSGSWPPEGVVPTVLELADWLDISPNTANRVLKALLASGYLEKPVGRKGYVLRDAVRPARLSEKGVSRGSNEEKAGSKRANEISAHLRSEILSGTYDDEIAFPRNKEIQALYRVSHRTAASALQKLAQWGLIERNGANYRTKYVSEPAGKRIFILGRSSMVRYMPYERFIDGAQKHIARFGWPPPVYSYITSGNTPSLPPADKATAFIAVDDEGRALLKRQEYKTIPKVLLDTGGIIGNRTAYGDSAIISPDHEHSGHQTARYLAQQGHRHVVFFSHIAITDTWLERRLKGVTDIFPRDKRGERSIDIHVQKFIHSSENGSRFQAALSAEMGRFTNTENWERFFPLQLFRKYFALNGFNIADTIRLSRSMRPVFEEAFHKNRYTAWICVNDEMAIAAHTFLQQAARPRDANIRVALMGFDNNPMTQLSGISTYDFRYDVLGRLAVECIARPQAVFGRRTNRSLFVPGTLVLRATTFDTR